MNRARLASLLRLRRLQEDRAAGELARATARRDEAGRQVVQTREALAGVRPPDAASADVWTARVAARGALGAAFVDARQLAELVEGERQATHRGWQDARRATRTVEHLDDKAREQEEREELRAAQAELDEHAQRRRDRGTR